MSKNVNKAKINVEFNEASKRENIESGESVNTLFGKIKKIITDLHDTAFTGNAAKVNSHTVNSDVPANAKFTDTTYSNATTSAAGLMSASDKAKLDETRLWRRCVVGQSSDTITNPYYKFASISLSDVNYDAAITFKVSLNFEDKSTCLGISV